MSFPVKKAFPFISSRPNVYPKNIPKHPTPTPLISLPITKTLFPLTKTYKKFLTRLAEPSEKISIHHTNHLHIEYTRFIKLIDQVKGLHVDDALLQLSWHRKPITQKFMQSLESVLIKAKNEGLCLSKLYIGKRSTLYLIF